MQVHRGGTTGTVDTYSTLIPEVHTALLLQNYTRMYCVDVCVYIMPCGYILWYNVNFIN